MKKYSILGKKILYTSLSFFLFFIFFSCKKNNISIADQINSKGTEGLPIIDGHVSDIKKISMSDLPSNVNNVIIRSAGSWDYNSIRLINYSLSSINLYEIKSKLKNNTTLLLIYKNKKYFKVISTIERIGENLQQFKFLSPEGEEYFEFKLADGKFGSGLKVKNNMPFERIANTSISNRSVTPTVTAPPEPPPTSGNCTSLPFNECMSCASKECTDDWRCFVMCGLNPVACAVGWALGCGHVF